MVVGVGRRAGDCRYGETALGGFARPGSRNRVKRFCQTQRGFNRLRGHAEVRRTPHDAALSNEQGLRRLVPHAQLSRDGIRDVAMSLDGYHRVARIHMAFVQMGDELIERLGADPAREAVFEKQQRPLIGGGQGPVELVHPGERFQCRVHFFQCNNARQAGPF